MVLPNTTGMRAEESGAAEFGKDWGQSRAELCLQPQSLRHFHPATTHSLQLCTSCLPLKKKKKGKLFAEFKHIYMVLQRMNPTTAQLSSSIGHQLQEKHFTSTPLMGAWMNCISTRCILEKIVLDTFGTRHLGER